MKPCLKSAPFHAECLMSQITLPTIYVCLLSTIGEETTEYDWHSLS